MLATMVCFTSLDSTMKYALGYYPLLEVTWARFFFATLFAMVIVNRKLSTLVHTVNLPMQLARASLLAVTTGLFNAGVSALPLPTATTIMFMSPLVVTLLSGSVLGEHVGWRRFTSVAVGFIGAVIVIRIWETGLANLDHHALFLLAAACTNASYQILTRMLRNENPYTTLLYSAAVGAVVTSALMLVYGGWQTPDARGWSLFLMSGLFGCVGHLCLIRAYSIAPASVIAPFSYSSLIWATILGFVIWGDWPMATTWIGASLIIGSGIYIFWRETRLGISRS